MKTKIVYCIVAGLLIWLLWGFVVNCVLKAESKQMQSFGLMLGEEDTKEIMRLIEESRQSRVVSIEEFPFVTTQYYSQEVISDFSATLVVDFSVPNKSGEELTLNQGGGFAVDVNVVTGYDSSHGAIVERAEIVFVLRLRAAYKNIISLEEHIVGKIKSDGSYVLLASIYNEWNSHISEIKFNESNIYISRNYHLDVEPPGGPVTTYSRIGIIKLAPLP